MLNNKRFAVSVLFLLLLILLSACAPSGLRIVSLSPSQTEIVYNLGLEDKLVGWSRYDCYPPEVQERKGWLPYDKYTFISNEEELSKDVAVVSNFTSINYELIALLEPTLILAIEPLQKPFADSLKALGYNVLYYHPETLDDVWAMINDIGEKAGVAMRARRLTAKAQQEIEAIRKITEELPKIKVYFEINHMGPYVLGSGSPMDQLLDIAGGVNIFKDTKGIAFKAELSDIIERDPDVILTPLWPHAGEYEVTTIREIVTRPGFENITAVKNDRVYHYDSSLLKCPSLRQVNAAQKLAYLLHPYYFKNPENSVSPWELGKIDATYPPEKPLK
ncbi:MAG: ABC transporter substrate-binding protein [Candidatus Marinimicrobia bacterium]|jgi:iron complex transport system substrate-binding protein|nr:ABC transporter substrate-binding protein [Candidatus Neomarinimicrobiota bacterium]MDX9777425.1 ABC transporter substrate-binding protein [bacterium]